MSGNKWSGALWLQSGDQRFCRLSVGWLLSTAESPSAAFVPCGEGKDGGSHLFLCLKLTNAFFCWPETRCNTEVCEEDEGTPVKRMRWWEQDPFSQLNIKLLFNANWVALPRSTLGGLIQDHAFLINFWGYVRQHEERRSPVKAGYGVSAGSSPAQSSWPFTNRTRSLWSDMANPSP